MLIAAANEAGEAFIIHKDVWPARFTQIVTLAMDGVATMDNRNEGKKGPDGKALPKDDSVSRFLSQMSRHVTERAVHGVELTEESAATKASELRVACNLGLLNASDGINGLFVLADAREARAKLGTDAKSVFQTYADVGRETIKAKARLSADALLPIVRKAKTPEVKLSGKWLKAFELLKDTLTNEKNEAYDTFEGRAKRETLVALIDAQYKVLKNMEDDAQIAKDRAAKEEEAREASAAADEMMATLVTREKETVKIAAAVVQTARKRGR